MVSPNPRVTPKRKNASDISLKDVIYNTNSCCVSIFLSFILHNVLLCLFLNSECVKRKGSGASLGSTVMFKSMDDIREYDDDIQNFGEDGSFVGKYSEKPLYE